jgi:hypothetical protein
MIKTPLGGSAEKSLSAPAAASAAVTPSAVSRKRIMAAELAVIVDLLSYSAGAPPA